MIRKNCRFLFSVLAAVCILACCMAMPVFAAEVAALTDNITASADDTGNLTIDSSTSGTYKMTVTDSSKKSWWQTSYTANTRTLTFTNNYPGWVEITYKLTSSNSTGSHQLNSGAASSTEQSGTITVGKGETFTIKVVSSDNDSTKSATDTSNTVTFEYEIGYEPLTPDITFAASANGTYTVTDADGATVDVGSTAQSAKYTLTASPATGYKIYRWKFTASDGSVTYFGRYESPTTYTASVAGTITCEFVKSDAAMYSVGTVKYAYLDEANTAAKSGGKQIVLAESGTVYGSAGTSITIDSGVTLVLPYASGGTTVKDSTASFPYANYTTVCQNNTYAPQPTARDNSRTYLLTIPSGTIVNNNGIISVGGTLHGNSTLSGNHSNLQIEKGAKLNLESGSVLSVIGYVYGGGEVVTTGTGAKIYQPFSLLRMGSSSWGAGATGAAMDLSWTDSLLGGVGMIDVPDGCYNGTNPSPRYCTQAIQCPLTMNYGNYMYGYAEQHTYGNCYASTLMLIGTESNTNAQILLKSGATLKSTYDGSRKSTTFGNIGKLTLTISGGASQGSMSLTLKGYTIALEKWPLPVPYNYDIVLKNGTYDLGYEMSLLPGAGLTVGSDAILNVNSSLAVFTGANDHTSYGPTSSPRTVNYNGSEKSEAAYPRNSTLTSMVAPDDETSSTMANLVVNGTMNVNGSLGGIVQTTGGGEIKMNGSAASFTRQLGLVGKGKDGTDTLYFAGATLYTFVPQYFDANGTLQTMESGKTYLAANTEANDVDEFTFNFYSSSNYSDTSTIMNKTESVTATAVGQWYDCELTFDANAGEETVEGEMEALKVNSGATVTLPENTFVREGYTFTGWNTAADGTGTAFNIEKDESGNALPIEITVTDDIIVADETGVGKVILYAQWEKDEVSCKLILDPNYEGAEKIEAAITPSETYGAAFDDGKLPTPVQEGYYFEGWFINLEDTDPITDETIVEVTEGTTEITLIAKWTEKTEPTEADFTVTLPDSLVYDGTAKNVKVTVASGEIVGMGEISVKYLNADKEEVAAEEVINAGTYTYNISVAEGDRYLAADNVVTGTFTIEKADRSAPAVTGTDETISGKNDGSISGLTTEMEWSTDQKEWKPINGTELTSLEPGTYYIRYAENENYNASPAAEVIIKSGCMISITWKQDDGSVIGTTEVAYDVTPNHADAEKAADKDYYYTFSGWTPEVVAATEDATYTATYTETARTYGEPTWKWNDTESATASFTTNDDQTEFVETVDAKITNVHVDATCEKDGSDTYTATVTFGGKEYTDDETEVIEALGHNYGETSYTWSKDGKNCTAKHICVNDASHVEEVTATITSKITNPASCTVMGTTTYTATFDVEWATAQTTTRQDVAVIAHTYDQKKIEDTYKKSDATCTAAAVYYYSCSCGEKGTETFENGEANGHSYANAVVNFSDDGTTYTVTVTCGDCVEGTEGHTKTSETSGSTVSGTTAGDCQTNSSTTYSASGDFESVSYSDTKTVDGEKGNHSYDNGVVTEPTCEEGGYTTYTCQVAGCSHSYTASETPAKNHSWSVSYSWSEDGKSCTATRVCANDAAHNETETVTAIGAVKTEATCMDMGWTTYTADFEAEWAETQCKDVQDIAQLQHSYTGEIKSDGDGQTATHSYKCVNGCNEYGGAVKHAWNGGEQTKDPACEAAGEMTYTCTVEGCGATYTEEIEATGHVNTTSKTEQNTDDKTHTTTVTCDCGHVVSTTTENCIDSNNDFACDVCRGLLVNAYTDAIAVAEGYTAEKSVDGSTVTLNYTGDVAFVQAQGTGAWNHWVGFKITSPVDMSKVTILRPDNQTRVMADIKDGDDYAYLYWGMTNDSDKKAEYKIDWNDDGTYDLTVILDATEAKLLECSHSWGEGVVTTPASCTAEGTMTYTCANCGATKPETIQATGHKNTVTVKAKDATCGEAGYTGDTYCNDCKNTIETGEVIQATGAHIYDDPKWNWEGSDEAGYTAATVTVTCTCGDAKTGTDKELDKVTTDASYEADGSVVYTAKVTIEGEKYTATKTVTIPKIEVTGYTVTLDDRTKGVAIRADLEDGKNYAPGHTFTVTCEQACVVAISTDNKATYEELSCVNVGENAYRFTIPEDIDCNFWIGIVLRGDATGDGAVKTNDSTRILRWYAGGFEKNNTLDALTELAADANGKNGVKTNDATRILRWYAGGFESNNTLDWRVAE